MNHAVTYGGLVHIGLMIAFVISLFGTGWFWLYVFAASMSDSPSTGPSQGGWKFLLCVAHGLPIALLIAWFLT